VEGRGDLPAITWESDEGKSQVYTFRQLLDEVNACALALSGRGVTRGDVVTIYLPMIPALLFSMLACARLGAIHSVVFAGFSDAALCERIVNGRSTTVITADAGVRGGRIVPLKSSVDKACEMAAARGSPVSRVFVTHRAGKGVGVGTEGWEPSRDISLDAAVENIKSAAAGKSISCPPVAVGAEDPLFLLYTSGSTGKPKGIIHTVGGYMVYAATTFKYV